MSSNNYPYLLQLLQDLKLHNPQLTDNIDTHLNNISKTVYNEKAFIKAIAYVKECKSSSINAVFPSYFSLNFFMPLNADNFLYSKVAYQTLLDLKAYEKSLETELNNSMPPGQNIILTDLQILTSQKLTVIKNCILVLRELDNLSDTTLNRRLSNCKNILDTNKDLLEIRRDSGYMTVLKGLATIVTLGLAAALGIWKTRGEKLGEVFNENYDIIQPLKN